MKVAIVYDRVNKWGGAERVLLTLHEMFPEAPLYTSVYDSENAVWAEVFPKVYTSFLQYIPFAKNNHEFFFWAMPFVFGGPFNFSARGRPAPGWDEYDLVISVTSEFAKNLPRRQAGINVKYKHVCYCLTPTRYLWSHEKEYVSGLVTRQLVKPLLNYLKFVDKKAAQKPDLMIAISTEVQDRIKKYYGRESKIIFPPVDILKFSSHKKFENLRSRRTSWPDLSNFSSVRKNDYYLVVSRLVKYKKVDLVIEAFNELQLPLVIVGTGREEKRLKSMIKFKRNIIFLGSIMDQELAKVYKNAKALIFPQHEDFGITAVEAQSYGIPVIAYKAGGVIDTVSKNTGVFFEEQTKESLIKAVRKFDTKVFDTKILRSNAKRFSKKRFKDEFLQLTKKL